MRYSLSFVRCHAIVQKTVGIAKDKSGNAMQTGAEHIELAVPESRSGKRLDQVLADLLPGRSRAFIRKIFDRGEALADGLPAKPAQKVKAGQIINLTIPAAEPLEAKPEDLPLDILYEDEHLLVLNKRPGMVSHPSQGHREGTLVNALLHHYGEALSAIGGVLRPGIVHRLDKDTSGCLVAAKTDAAHAGLMRQFMNREITKIYLALTEGAPKPQSGTIEGNIGRSTRDRKLHAMLKTGGRPSLTVYRTLENYGALALVECRLLTGRTHQARVHMAHAGAPILCDREYGRREAYTDGDAHAALALMTKGEKLPSRAGQGHVLLARQGLHAARLQFRHPAAEEEMSFEAPFPDDMASVLEPFRKARNA